MSIFTRIKNFFKRLFKKEEKHSEPQNIDLDFLYMTLDKLDKAHSALSKKLAEGYFGNGIIVSEEELAELKEQLNTIKIKVSPENKENVDAMVESLDSKPITTNKEAQKSEELLQMTEDIWKIKKTVDNAILEILNPHMGKLFKNSMPKKECRPINFIEGKEGLNESDPDYAFDGRIFRTNDIYDKTSPIYDKEITFVDNIPKEYINKLTHLDKDAFLSGYVLAIKPAKGEVIYFCKNKNTNREGEISFLKRLGIQVPDYNAVSETEKIWKEYEERLKSVKCGGMKIGSEFEANENSKKEGE